MSERTHIPLVHKPKPKKKPNRIKKVSPKRREALKRYDKARVQYLSAHPYCEQWLAATGPAYGICTQEDVNANLTGRITETHVGVKAPRAPFAGADVWVPRSNQIHHKKGRVGELLWNPEFFMAVCDDGHAFIHKFTGISYARGWMLPRNK
jgi:hypothetical protein